jgi:hypothetical protein
LHVLSVDACRNPVSKYLTKFINKEQGVANAVKRAGFRIAARRIVFSTLGQTRRHIAQHAFAYSHMSATQAAAEHPATFEILSACLFRDCTRRT